VAVRMSQQAIVTSALGCSRRAHLQRCLGTWHALAVRVAGLRASVNYCMSKVSQRRTSGGQQHQFCHPPCYARVLLANNLFASIFLQKIASTASNDIHPKGTLWTILKLPPPRMDNAGSVARPSFLAAGHVW
jgi:hypothetical protein